jgi:hypothetical protein
MKIGEAAKQRMRETAPLLMSREEAARTLGGLHISTIGKLARAGKLQRVFVGRRSMVTAESVHKLAAGSPTAPRIVRSVEMRATP